MKKQFFKAVSVKTYATALLTSIILLSAFTKAGATESADSAQSAKVTYIGLKGKMVGFNVNFTNTVTDKFVLELIDEEGKILFYRKISDKNFNKDIYLKNEGEGDHCKVKFIIKAGKNEFNHGFDISTKQTFVEDLVVTRL